jgi:hypothetical protein
VPEPALAPATPALYPLLLGSAWASIAAPVRRLHAGISGSHGGTFQVARGTSVLSRLLGWLMGLPAAGPRVPVTLELRVSSGGELWRRSFAGRTVITTQYRRAAELIERFGLVECRFRLEAREGALWFVQTGAAFRLGPLAIPLPRWGCPRVTGIARPAGEAVGVEVTIGAPLAGTLVDYRGEITIGEAR